MHAHSLTQIPQDLWMFMVKTHDYRDRREDIYSQSCNDKPNKCKYNAHYVVPLKGSSVYVCVT